MWKIFIKIIYKFKPAGAILPNRNNFNIFVLKSFFKSNTAYVSLISFKGKWYYESCPKCKRGGAESNNSCIHCGAFIEEAISRFILPIEIADYSGSIWTTAFDEFALVILQGKDINLLKKFDEVKLR